MKIEITLRSGAKVVGDVKEYSFVAGTNSGELRELHWITPKEGAQRLQWVDLSQIAAVVAIREDGDEKEDDAP